MVSVKHMVFGGLGQISLLTSRQGNANGKNGEMRIFNSSDLHSWKAQLPLIAWGLLGHGPNDKDTYTAASNS